MDPILNQIDEDIYNLKLNQTKLKDLVSKDMFDSTKDLNEVLQSINNLLEEGDQLVQRIQTNSKQMSL